MLKVTYHFGYVLCTRKKKRITTCLVIFCFLFMPQSLVSWPNHCPTGNIHKMCEHHECWVNMIWSIMTLFCVCPSEKNNFGDFVYFLRLLSLDHNYWCYYLNITVLHFPNLLFTQSAGWTNTNDKANAPMPLILRRLMKGRHNKWSA